MRVMVIMKANKDSEGGVMPSEKILTEMGNYNEELVNAGIMRPAKGCTRARRVCASVSRMPRHG